MRFWAFALALAVAQPAWSLSCLQPNVATDFAFADASDDSFIVVRGDLSFDEGSLPKRTLEKKPPPETEISAWFRGHSLTKDGFTRVFDRDVTLQVTCLAHWCGGTTQGDHLAFLKQDGARFLMRLEPCGSLVYPNPTKRHLDTVQSCIRGEACAFDQE